MTELLNCNALFDKTVFFFSWFPLGVYHGNNLLQFVVFEPESYITFRKTRCC